MARTGARPPSSIASTAPARRRPNSAITRPAADRPARRADHGREIAAEVARMADIQARASPARPRAARPPRRAHRRNPQPFVPDLGRRWVIGAVRRAADVGLVRADNGPEYQGPVENRHERGQIRQMGAAAIGIVQQIDVAGRIRPEELVHRLRRQRHGADVHRDMIRLGDQPAAGSNSAIEKSRVELRICE